MRRGGSITGLGALVLCTPLACTELDPLDDTCLNVDGQTCDPMQTRQVDSGSSPVVAGPWDCLGSTRPRMPPIQRPPGVAFVVPIVDFANPPTPPRDLRILVCQDNDFDCTQPLPIPDMQPEGAPAYVHQLNLPFGFEGYLRLTATGYIQSEYYFLGPVIGGPNGEQVIYGDGIGLPRNDTIDNFFDQFGQGAARQAGTGLVGLRVYDCRNESAEAQQARTVNQLRRATGVRLELVNSEARAWTLVGGRPAAPAPGNPSLSTDDRGVAGFFNIQPMALIVQAIAPNGERYGQTNVTVRPDQLTQANIRPNYSFAD